MSQKTKIIISIAFPILGLLIIAVIAATFLMSSTANPPDFNQLYNDGTLQTGRYYLNGDKENFYYEVFEDQTLQLGGGDPIEFILMFNGLTLKDLDDSEHDEDFLSSVRIEADWRSSRINYVVIENFWSEKHTTVNIMLHAKTVEDVINNSGGRCFVYIDEKTFDIGGEIGGFIFIRTD
ncbi:MAG: hypothetical protein LBC82_03110 [Oscillospiraceae bacterium]|jgi:hypothetical protein|nr:hypothetical protein [Oscillospiraceae bacterium]